jgi:hypothetical protein
MSRGITKSKLKQKHPRLAEVLDSIEATNKKKHYWFFANYDGKYTTPTGGPRTVSLGAIIDVINEYGMDVEINVVPDPSKKRLWEPLVKP